MDELFTPVSTTYLRQRRDEEPLLVEARPPAETARISKPLKVGSADDALSVLKSQPDYDSLTAVLRFLVENDAGFSIYVPSSKSAAIIHILVSDTVPNYWNLLQEGSSAGEPETSASTLDEAAALVTSLQSVAGINAVMGHIKALVRESKLAKRDVNRPDLKLHLGLFLDLLSTLLDGDDSIQEIWKHSTAGLPDAVSKKVQSQSLISLVSSGRIISISAEALELVGKEEARTSSPWLVDGAEYSKWIGRNIAAWAKARPEGIEHQSCFDVFQRSLSLGYSETLVTIVIDQLLLSRGSSPALFPRVCLHQTQVSKKVLYILLEHLSRKFLNDLDPEDTKSVEKISAVAGVLDDVIQNDKGHKWHLLTWCCSPSGAGLGHGIGIRRAVVAVLAKDRETITSLLEKSLNQFGDQLYIKHTAILQQEAHVQVLLLSAAYVAKLSPLKLTMILRSGSYLSTISNRIASTNSRARFLGMCVGEGLSAILDNNAKKLDFHTDELETEEARWLKGLTRISDPIGPVEPLLANLPPPQPAKSTSRQAPKQQPKKGQKQKRKPQVSEPAPKAIIEEIDSSDDGDDDLPTAAKSSDDEDSDDDPTLVQRNKPKPPVYVRDLITFLRDSESYEKQKLGAQTAPVLIRRKANYGTEVSSHAEELARLLVGLQDKFEMDNFEDLRLQSMIALVVAQPRSMAPWFARTFFEGDYSLSQRTSVLVTLGLSARELAGLETSDYQSLSSFPSKRLPGKLEQLYLDESPAFTTQSNPSSLGALPLNAINSIAHSLTATFLGPLAAEAADANAGPDALKLQTFSARYKSKSRIRPRTRAIPNTTAATLGTYFFSPLAAHFQFALRSSKPVVLNPTMLALYLQTLGIIVNAAGPSTLSLPQLTSELWDLLLRVRVHVVGDLGALKGWLVAMSVLLEVNQDNMRRICEEQGREVVESREWVSGVFERTRGDDGGEENDVKMLAAGVLIKLGEAIEKYQALLMGDMLGFY
ncbi:telomere binding protein [Metarhizium rileyi]|uniref:Telomere binding protein n=1 Tax=Metarhizium rileyi (strain RCEF 4871) TaxID=1649241 RepID=A0A5C6GHU0_METRR|nr:telomere binding protein [Metarhizium rileyi]